jgi:rhodanese-related sulfurtransferase
MALQFMAQGYKKVYVLKDGQVGWERAKYPVEPK